jgi:hypothetical protein
VIRAHQQAAGAQRAKGPYEQALGRSQGGFSAKLHLRAEGGGKPMTLLLTAGQPHEQTQFEALMEQGAVKRAGRGGRGSGRVGWRATRPTAVGQSGVICVVGASGR